MSCRFRDVLDASGLPPTPERLRHRGEPTLRADKRHPSCDGADREEGRGSNEHHDEDHELPLAGDRPTNPMGRACMHDLFYAGMPRETVP